MNNIYKYKIRIPRNQARSFKESINAITAGDMDIFTSTPKINTGIIVEGTMKLKNE